MQESNLQKTAWNCLAAAPQLLRSRQLSAVLIAAATWCISESGRTPVEHKGILESKSRELNVEGVFRLKASEAASLSGEVVVSTRSLPLPLESRSRRDPVRCPFYLLMTVLGTVTCQVASCPSQAGFSSVHVSPAHCVRDALLAPYGCADHAC